LKDACACALGQKYAFLFDGLFATPQAFANECQPYLNVFRQVSSQNVFDFLNQPNNKLLLFIPELMDVFHNLHYFLKMQKKQLFNN